MICCRPPEVGEPSPDIGRQALEQKCRPKIARVRGHVDGGWPAWCFTAALFLRRCTAALPPALLSRCWIIDLLH
eukprot:scaffold8123_cov95-Isochrysis_galbana.AAC.1